jgi:ankyrin repeat protein
MASQVMTVRDIPIAEQHEFIDFAKQFEWETVKRLVNAKPSIVNVQPAMRWSALHQAAFAGSADAVCFLLRNHAATDAKTADGKTPLEVAKTAHLKAILSDFTRSGKVPTPSRASNATSKCKAGKAMKGMKKTKVKSKIAKGKRGKALVYKGLFAKTRGGLTHDQLTKNKKGKIVRRFG